MWKKRLSRRLPTSVASQRRSWKKKKEVYLDHLSGDPTLKFQEFKCLYRDLSSGKKDDDFLEEYVEAIFRAFDANKDDQLSFREWQVGFYLLLLLPKEGDEMMEVNKEDFLLAMEIIFRLYDQDGNSVVTKREVHQLRSLLGEEAVAARLGPGVTKLGHAVDSIDLNRYEGGINQEQFLDYFTSFVEEKEARV